MQRTQIGTYPTETNFFCNKKHLGQMEDKKIE